MGLSLNAFFLLGHASFIREHSFIRSFLGQIQSKALVYLLKHVAACVLTWCIYYCVLPARELHEKGAYCKVSSGPARIQMVLEDI